MTFKNDVIETVQNRPVLSIIMLNGTSKNIELKGKYLANGKYYEFTTKVSLENQRVRLPIQLFYDGS